MVNQKLKQALPKLGGGREPGGIKVIHFSCGNCEFWDFSCAWKEEMLVHRGKKSGYPFCEWSEINWKK